MKPRRPNWKTLATIAFVLFMAWLFAQLGGDRYGKGTEWLWAFPGALLGLYLVKPFGHYWWKPPEKETETAAVSYPPRQSPRAEIERRWRRLGSVRGNLLTDVDRQSDLSEALYRLEYGPKANGDESWRPPMDKAQAYDLQMPSGKRKRKGKPPKRQRYG